jgi:general secretion pathway protein I
VRTGWAARVRVGGFTLIEVMLALAILGVALVILVKSIAGNITAAQDSFYMGVATDLARGKMYDVEEDLLQEGFQETEQEDEGDFSEEGWDNIKWKVKIEPVELPSFDVLMGLAQGEAGGGAGNAGGDGEGEGGEGESQIDKFQSSALGGMLGMFGFGGGGGGEAAGASEQATSGFIQSQYTLVQQVLKQAIRKITLTISYDTGVHKEEFAVILYVTDAAGMQKVLGSLGLQ